jgi:hypothetical protein
MSHRGDPPGEKAARPLAKDRGTRKTKQDDDARGYLSNREIATSSLLSTPRRLVMLYSNKPRLALFGYPSPVKKLLVHAKGCWLFETRHVSHISYAVELGDRAWEYSQLSSAETKFISVLNQGGAHRG